MLDTTTVITFAAYLALLVLMVAQLRNCDRKGEPLAWVFWAIHGLIYTAIFFVDYQDRNINAQLYNVWSVTLRIHGLITLISVEASRYKRMRVKNGC